ncbi:hypothetical protein ABPG75_002067 [Micractinium tetrahymenae]
MLCGMEPLCECGLAVVRTAGSGSASALAQLLGSSKGTDTPGRQVPWQLEGTELQCMRADSGWGIVGQHGAAPWCLTCRSQQRSCPHVSLLLEGDLVGSSSSTGPTSTWLPPAKSEERFVQDFDLVAGQRRLTCLSRERLPARPQDDPELHQLLTDRKAGNYKLPPVAAPSERACPNCSTNSWTVRQGAPCTVFMQTHSVSMRFDELVCACGCVLQVDGKELGLLRVKPGFAVDLGVLYEWRERMKNGGVSFWQFWVDLLARYSASVETQRAWLQQRSAFEDAALDFMQLQVLDLEGGFWCEHVQNGGHLNCDCITVSIHHKQAFIVHPWYQQQRLDGGGGAVPLVYGSAFSSRVFFIADSCACQSLLGICRSKGISADEHRQLISTLQGAAAERPERALLPFLRSATQLPTGNVTLHGQRCCALLRDLATRAPACTVLKPCVFDLVDSLLATPAAPLLDLEQHRRFVRHCPVLYGFLQLHLRAGALPQDVCALLRALRKVAEAASVPDKPPSQTTGPLPQRRLSAARMAYAVACEAGLPAAEQWRSKEEAFVRTACWGGPPQGDGWQSTRWGGSHILYPLPEYAAEQRAAGSSGSSSRAACTKHKDQNGKLMPGLLLVWCTECRKCVYFQMLPDAESPVALVHALRTRWPCAPRSITYDNGCNGQHQALNREPEWFKETEWFVDEPHYRGHKDCTASFNTGMYDWIKCSPLSEQQNKRLRSLENHVSYMRQLRALYYLRYFLYLSNELADDAAAGRCFYK